MKFDEVREMLMLLSQTGTEEHLRSVVKQEKGGFHVLVSEAAEGPTVAFDNVLAFKDWIITEHGPKVRSHITSGSKCR